MSTIAAIVSAMNRDGSLLAAELHAVLAPGMEEAEAGTAERIATWTNGRAALGACSSAADGNGRQPYVDRASGSAIVLDGRIDNLDELRGALGVPANAEMGAPALVLSAYMRWGETAAARILGDFAFAIWDTPGGRLFCARDALGQRPLFYTVRPGATIAASHAHQVLAYPGVPAVPDEGVIAEILAGLATTVEDTIWRGVRRVPQAHSLVVADGGARVHRYWDFDLGRELDYRRPEEYDEHFRELFDRAVACRVAGEQAVGIFLSGGIDSSAIVGTAAAAARGGGPALRQCSGQAIHTVSLTFSGDACDESRFIDDTVRRWNLPSDRIVFTPTPWVNLEREVDRFRHLPLDPAGGVANPLHRRARALGLRVMLTGLGGDEWFSGSSAHSADLLRRGRVIAAARQCWHDAHLPGRGFTYLGLARGAVGPLLPAWARRMLRPVAGARPLRHDWIPETFAARVALRDRIRPLAPPSAGSLAQRAIYRLANGIQRTLGDEHEQRMTSAAGLDQRHPFYDRRVAEFGLALPERERAHLGVTKVIVRRALADRMAESVRARADKAEFSPIFAAAIAAAGGRRAFERLRSADLGWVDGRVAQGMHDEMIRLYSAGDAAYIRLADALWTILSIDLWLERALKGKSYGTDSRPETRPDAGRTDRIPEAV